MRGWIEQRLMLVLTVQFDESIGEVAQRGGRRECAVDERAAATLAVDFPSDDQLRRVGRFEDRFDAGLRLTGAHEIRGRAVPKQQSDRFDEDRFAGSGLSGEDVEPLLELDVDGV